MTWESGWHFKSKPNRPLSNKQKWRRAQAKELPVDENEQRRVITGGITNAPRSPTVGEIMQGVVSSVDVMTGQEKDQEYHENGQW